MFAFRTYDHEFDVPLGIYLSEPVGHHLPGLPRDDVEAPVVEREVCDAAFVAAFESDFASGEWHC